MIKAVLTRDKLIKVLCLRLFPNTPRLKASVEILTDRNRNKAIEYIESCKAYEMELRQLSDMALLVLAKDEKEHDRQIAEEDAEQKEYNRFFFDRSALADYTDWQQRERWTVDEATALLLGKNPNVVNWHSINPLVFKSHFAKRYAALREQIKSAQASGGVQETNTPEAFLHFARSAGFALPRELEAVINPIEDEPKTVEPDQGSLTFQRILEEKLQRVDPTSSENEHERVDTRSDVSIWQERDFLLKVFGAMSVNHYGFETGSNNMLVAKKIVTELDKSGVSVDPYKILRLLNDAAKLAPNQNRSD